MGNGKTETYSHYVAAINNEGLYSAESVIRNGHAKGLVPDHLDGKELEQYIKNATHSMRMRALRKMHNDPDGVDKTNPNNPQHAFLGIRWKATISPRFLDEEDREYVTHFQNNETFRDLFLKRPLATLRRIRQSVSDKAPTGFLNRDATELNRLIIGFLLLLLVAVLLWSVPTEGSLQQVKSLARNNDVASLRKLLLDPSFQDLHPTIIKAISDSNLNNQGPPLVLKDISSISAVFALEQDPMLVFESRVVRLGDRMTLSNEHGYVSEINRQGFILRTGRGSREFQYPLCSIFGFDSWRSQSITIFENPNNLMSLLSHIANTQNFKLKGAPAMGAVAGSFNCHTYREFLETISEHAGLEIYGETIEISEIPDNKIRAIIGYDGYFPYILTSLGTLLDFYQKHLNIKLILNSQSDLDLKIIYPPTQFNDFITTLNFEARVLSHNLIEIGDRK